MSEADSIAITPTPRTRESLAKNLRSLGLEAGTTLIVHSSLSAIGWVSGGPIAVVQALMDVITPEGTLVMPAHSGNYSEPSNWSLPPVPESWWDDIRASMPAFDPRTTPTLGMGQIPEAFRTFPDVMRSYHPAVSFTAWGRHSRSVTDAHSLDFSLGEASPLARLYDLDGWIMLLGVGYENNTAFHLAQYRIPERSVYTEGGPVLENGVRVWKEFTDIELDTTHFIEIGAELDWSNKVIFGDIGSAQTRLLRVREAVDFAAHWLATHA